MTSPTERVLDHGSSRRHRALLVGTGLIGGSLGLALRQQGWHVSGLEADPARAARALELGVLDVTGDDPAAEIAFVATPAPAVAEIANRLLEDPGRPELVVSDVAGVKAAVVGAVDSPRFVGGHPMAGSEQVGVEGADPGLFTGATWVLTPTATTDPSAYARVQAVVTMLGAEVLALSPADHDRLVAVVSHVPHLVAATLMNIAARHAEDDAALLRLAAGGFRDMTRVAAGHPGIWPDLCAENAAAIGSALDRLIEDLAVVRQRVAQGDRGDLFGMLERASTARRALPGPLARPEREAELRVPVPDREGVLAELTTLASDLGVNIADITIAHSAEGPRGVLVMVVDAAQADKLRQAIVERGHRCTVQVIE